MFKGISRQTNQKREVYEKLGDTTERIRKALDEYLYQEFGEDITSGLIKYEWDFFKKSLQINSSSKTIASEIKLTLSALTTKLKERGVLANSIVVL